MGGSRKSSKSKSRKAKTGTVGALNKHGAPGDPFAYLVPPEQVQQVECVSNAGKREISFVPCQQKGKPVQTRIVVASILNNKKKLNSSSTNRKVIQTIPVSTSKKRPTNARIFESFPIGDVGLCPQSARKLNRRPASAPVKKRNDNDDRSKDPPFFAIEVRRQTLSRPAGSSSFLATGRDQAKLSLQGNPNLGPGSYNTNSPDVKTIASNTALKQIKSDYSTSVVPPTRAVEKPPNKESSLAADARPHSTCAGTSSFKASQRQAFRPLSAAAHLSSHQYQPKIDATRNRSLNLVSQFDKDSSPRNPPGAVHKTPPFLGPGEKLCIKPTADSVSRTYVSLVKQEMCFLPGSHFKKPPPSYTGKHLQAGHKSGSKVPNIAKYSPRPGSAPPKLKLQAEQVVQPWLDRVEEEETQAIEDFVYEDDGSCSDTDQAIGALVDELPLEHPLESQRMPSTLALFASDWGTPRCKKRSSSARSNPPPLGPGSYLGQDSGFSSTGFVSKPKGGTMSKCGRDAELRGMRAIKTAGVVLPVTAPQVEQNTASLNYEPKDHVQGHRTRAPSWNMPPNTVEKSKMWLFSGSGTLS